MHYFRSNVEHKTYTMTLEDLLNESKELTKEGAFKLLQAKRTLITARDEHKSELIEKDSYQGVDNLVHYLETILDLF